MGVGRRYDVTKKGVETPPLFTYMDNISLLESHMLLFHKFFKIGEIKIGPKVVISYGMSYGRVQIISPNIPAGDIGALSIIGNLSGSFQPVINPSGMLHITSNDNQAARITVDGFGSNIGAILAGRHARGTAKTPTPTLSGDILVRFAALGYATSSYFPIVGAVPTSLEFQATENYSTSSYGSRAAFYTYANGAISRSLAAIIDTDGLILPNVPTNETAEKILVWDSVTGRVGKQSGVSAIDGGAAASVFIMTTEVLNGGNA